MPAPPARGVLRQHAWSVGLEPGRDNFLRTLHALRVACHGGQELLTGEGPGLQAAQGGDGGCPGDPSQQGDLPERFTRTHLSQLHAVLGGARPALCDYVEALAGLPIPDDHVAGFVGRRLQFAGQVLNDRERQRVEERNLAQQGQVRARGRDLAVDGRQAG